MKKSETLFNELLNEWLENKRSEVKISTFCKYEQLIRLHLKPHFEELNCTNVNQIFLQNYYEILKNNAKDCRPLSNGTLRCVCMILNSALQYGQQNGYLKNLYRITPKLSRERHLVHVFSKEHQTLLEEYLFNNASIYSCGILLALYSGIRIGDADGKISLNQQKPSKHAGLRRFGPEKFLQRNNEFMKERPIFYKKPIKTEKDFSTWLRCFYYTTKAVITEYIYF